MRKIFFYIGTLLSIFMISCSSSEKVTYYIYEDVTITRIDINATAYFYYGKYLMGDTMPPAFMKSSYSGRDGIMDGYLVFKGNGIIEAIVSSGWFDEVEKNEKVIINNTIDNMSFSNWLDSIEGNYGNIVFVSGLIRYEIDVNKTNRSSVKAIYTY